MKKGLLMTSAIVAAGMLTLGDDAQAQMKPSNPVHFRIGGYMSQLVGVALNRPKTHQTGTQINGGVPVADAAFNTFDEQTEAEIHFVGDGKLDNGLAIRGVVELEVTGSPSGDIIDEQYLILRNGFGQVILGNEDPVAELMTAGYGNGLVTNAGQNMTYGTQNWSPPPPTFSASPTNSAARSAFIESPDNNDANKVIYVSPRFFGLQLGASYAPETRSQLNPGASPGTAGNTGAPDALKRLPLKDRMHDLWSFAANYEFHVSSAKFGIAAGYIQAAYPHMSFGFGGPEINQSNAKAFGAGARMDLGGWRAIVGWKATRNIEQQAGAVLQSSGTAIGFGTLFSTLLCTPGGGANCSVDGYGVNAGVLYHWGPNAVSLNARHGTEAGRKDAGNTNVDKIDNVIVAYRRGLAPGVSMSASWVYSAYNDESQTDIDYHSNAIVGSVDLRF